jgi:type II restriction enzyme
VHKHSTLIQTIIARHKMKLWGSRQFRMVASIFMEPLDMNQSLAEQADRKSTVRSDALTTQPLAELVVRFKADPESVYNTWFISGEERMKAFRSIRRGVADTVNVIIAGTFGNDFKGSPLEFVLNAITEQKQVFSGAAHPFYWKPKLRIPDIYENEANKRTFGMFLQSCLKATTERQVLLEISRLAAARIKGLGPAVANIVYFLHPTIVPPFNTAMVNGFNLLFDDNKKLGSWESYLAMREVIVAANAEVGGGLSKDLGAFAALLFEIGSGRLLAGDGPNHALRASVEKAEKSARIRHEEVMAEQREESEHTCIQHLLIRIGRALRLEVHVARNDRHRSCNGDAFSFLTVPGLPEMGWPAEILDTVSLIDVIWLQPGSGKVVCAFEIEKSTSIYSGILRMEDLARSIPDCTCRFYLVAPDRREKEVMAQLARPAFRCDLADIPFAYIPFDDLRRHANSLSTLGEDHTILEKIAQRPLSA